MVGFPEGAQGLGRPIRQGLEIGEERSRPAPWRRRSNDAIGETVGDRLIRLAHRPELRPSVCHPAFDVKADCSETLDPLFELGQCEFDVVIAGRAVVLGDPHRRGQIAHAATPHLDASISGPQTGEPARPSRSFTSASRLRTMA